MKDTEMEGGGGEEWREMKLENKEKIPIPLECLGLGEKGRELIWRWLRAGGEGVGAGGEKKGVGGGQGQQVHNTQGERPEGFVDKIKDKIPGLAETSTRVTQKVGATNKGKVSVRKGVVTRSRGWRYWWSWWRRRKEEVGQKKNSSAVTATKHLALLPCTMKVFVDSRS
ncbi:hypothetical protein IMY05_013G0057900 [Salix suchowensis]|nr:hypothetical protein IMY05_013G0057900 [Salix suchowensis]